MSLGSKPPFGVYAPLVTFFANNENIDLDSTKTHIRRMAKGGLAGLVLQGSNGESPHLGHGERNVIVRVARAKLDQIGFSQVKLIVSCGALASEKQYPTSMKLKRREVAEESALPLLIYSFPGVTSGIDINFDSVIRLGRKYPEKIVGVKLSCGNLGKLQRISSTLSGDKFASFGGKSDIFLPALVAGSHGVIDPLANVTPRTHVRLLQLYQSGDLHAAFELQSKLSHAD